MKNYKSDLNIAASSTPYSGSDQIVATGSPGNQLTIARVNQLMPSQIGFEIKSEKFRSLLLFWIGLSSLLVELFYLSCFLIHRLRFDYYLFGSDFVIPNPILMGILVIGSIMMIWFGFINWRQIIKEANFYLERCQTGQKVMPQFVINNYKRLVQRTIVFNWIFIPAYLLLGITLGILIGLEKYEGRAFQFGFWKIGNVPPLQQSIFIVAVTIAVVAIFHLSNWGLSKWRRGNILGYFGEDIIANMQIKNLQKRTNKICLWSLVLTLVVIFFVISIPILIFNKRKNNSRFKLPWRI